MSAAVPMICEKQGMRLKWAPTLDFCATVIPAGEKRKYLIEEAIDDGEVFPRVGGKDSSCVFCSSHVERIGQVPQGIYKV